MNTPDYVVVGHLTRDLLPDGAAPGGTVFYGAITAQRLGYRPAMLTAAAPGTLAPQGVAVAGPPSAHSSVFAHHYANGQRHQLVHSLASPLSVRDLPERWRLAPLAHLGPVIGEVDPALAFAFPNALLCVTPQGWLRRLDGPLPAPMAAAPWWPDEELLRRIDLLVLSAEDLAGHEGVQHYARHCRCVALTHGSAGVTLFVNGAPQHVPAVPAAPVDTNGAGDVFAAAMLLQLFECGEPLAAARFAAAAAALAVEGRGPSAIPSRAQLMARLRRPPAAG